MAYDFIDSWTGYTSHLSSQKVKYYKLRRKNGTKLAVLGGNLNLHSCLNQLKLQHLLSVWGKAIPKSFSLSICHTHIKYWHRYILQKYGYTNMKEK